ncbi:hypothetical protein Tco_0190792 [Tanacetum coccineum]
MVVGDQIPTSGIRAQTRCSTSNSVSGTTDGWRDKATPIKEGHNTDAGVTEQEKECQTDQDGLACPRFLGTVILTGYALTVKVKSNILGYHAKLVAGVTKLWRLDAVPFKDKGSIQVLQEVEFEVEPREDHAFEVEPLRNVGQGAGSQEEKQRVKCEFISDDQTMTYSGNIYTTELRGKTKKILGIGRSVRDRVMPIGVGTSSSSFEACYRFRDLMFGKGTVDVGLVYGKNRGNHVDVTCFVDSNYAKDPDKVIWLYGEAVKEAILAKGTLGKSWAWSLNTVTDEQHQCALITLGEMSWKLDGFLSSEGGTCNNNVADCLDGRCHRVQFAFGFLARR